MGAEHKTVISKDGTTIAYEQSGSGPVLILVSAALADHSGTARLAKHFSASFTVVNYDRRGRGASTDTPPYSPEKEVEDIQVLVEANGGSVFVFGNSSGSVLALDAANKLGLKVKKLFMFEPPFIVDNSHPAIRENLGDEISALVAQNRRNDAVKLFFTKGMGIPGLGVTLMRFLLPGWSKMAGMVHTAPYDLAILNGTQRGRPLPPHRWTTLSAPTLVAVGGSSEPFFHNGATSLVKMLPHAEYKSLKGMNHGAVLMSAAALASQATDFFLNQNQAGGVE
jgi:pimeloyl-ACP methyl ester carboxylesterase